MIRSLLRTKAYSSQTSSSPLSPIVFHHIPRPIPYARGLLLQETLVSRRLEAKKALTLDPTNNLNKSIASTDVLLLLQHSPVYTAGRRENDLETAQKEGERLGALGADYVKTMRGGQTTYHGPGQLVGYPIMDLSLSNLSTRQYVEVLESFLAQLAIQNGVPVLQPSPHTGVFTSLNHKIGSIGIHIRHRITLHGFSLNVEEQILNWFSHIVACGLNDVSATSIETELKKLGLEKTIKVEDVIAGTVELFGGRFGRDMIPVGKDHEWLKDLIEDGVEGKLPEGGI